MASASRACGDCKLFDVTKGKAGLCSWGIPECTGPAGTHAKWCPLFTDHNGYQPLLDCEEEDLPEWTRSSQMTLFD